jgi:hypothetical protein
MNTLSMVVPLMELILSSLRTYRFLFQAFGYQKFRYKKLLLRLSLTGFHIDLAAFGWQRLTRMKTTSHCILPTSILLARNASGHWIGSWLF